MSGSLGLRPPGEPTQNQDSQESKTYKIAVVDVSRSVEDKARDVAGEKLTAEKKELKGFKGFASKIWKHNLFHAYYRNKEIVKARNEIIQNKNLFAHESEDRQQHEEEMGAIVDRFSSELEGLIHEDAGESKELIESTGTGRVAKGQIIGLIKEFASDRIDEAVFEEEKTRLLATLQSGHPELLGSGRLYADNLSQMAKEIKESILEGVSLDDLDSRIDIIIGEARAGVRTEANYTIVDRLVEKMKGTAIGQFVNETTAASAIAIAGAIAQSATIGATSRALSWVTFGGSAMVGAGFAAIRENQRQKEERKQHARERAMGKEVGADSERRGKMETSRYETRTATELTYEIYEAIAGIAPNSTDQNSVEQAMGTLAQAEARNKLSDEQSIDLISYSSSTHVERERLQLDVARAEAKAYLRRIVDRNPSIRLPENKSFDEYLAGLTACQIAEITEGAEGIRAKDRIFNKMKNKEVAKVAVKGLLTGLVVGGVVHEIRGAITGEMTPAQWLYRYMTDQLPRSDMAEAYTHLVNSNGATVKLPENIGLEPNADGTFDFTNKHTGSRVIEQVSFNPDGTLTEESKRALAEMGVRTTETTNIVVDAVATTEQVSAKEFVEMNVEDATRIHRTLWFDNDTPRKYDLNELKLWWGGNNGINQDGDYVFNVSHMTKDGSFHSGFSANAEELVAEGKMKMLLSLSRDTQHTVFEVPIDVNGNAVIDKDSEIGRALFGTDNNGRAIFKGKFAEVAYSDGVARGGGESVKILATHIGEGVRSIETTITDYVDRELPQTLVDIPVKYDVIPPPVIPFFGRTPLEPLVSKAKKSPEYGGYGSGSGVESRRDKLVDFRKMYPDKKQVIQEAWRYAKPCPLIADKLKEIDQEPSDEAVQQLINLIIEQKKEGEKLFGKEFYENSEFVKKLNGAREVVIVLDDPIGDAVLTAPLIDVLVKYLQLTGQDKTITVKTKHNQLLATYESQHANVKVIDANEPVELTDDMLVLNGRKSSFSGNQYQSAESVNQEERKTFTSNVIDFEWLSWEQQAYPMKLSGRTATRVFRTLPGMIARNMEIILGIKLFDKLENQQFRLPLPPDNDQRMENLRSKYNLGDSYMVIAPSAGIKPKEYPPGKWVEVIDGLMNQPDWSRQIVITVSPDKKDAKSRFELTTALSSKPYRDRIVFVEEPLDNLATLINGGGFTLTPDTGIGHLSSALGKKTLMLTAVANPIIWQNPGRNMHFLADDERTRELIKNRQGVYSEAWDKENIDRYLTKSGLGLINLDPQRAVKRIKELFPQNPS